MRLVIYFVSCIIDGNDLFKVLVFKDIFFKRDKCRYDVVFIDVVKGCSFSDVVVEMFFY